MGECHLLPTQLGFAGGRRREVKAPFAASSSPKNPSLHGMGTHLPDPPALLGRSVLHKTLPPLCHSRVLCCQGPFLLFLPPQKSPPGDFAAAWLIRGQTPAAPQRVHGTGSGKTPLLGAEELGQAREDTQMLLVCFPQLSFFPYKETGI